MRKALQGINNFFSKNGMEIILGVLILLTLWSNLNWIRNDTLLGPEVDSKAYFVRTANFLTSLSTGGLAAFPEAFKELSVQGRPPLYQLLSLPFLLLFGRTMDSAVLVNLIFQVTLLILVFCIGKQISNSRAGLLMALLVSAYPPLIQLSRIYRPNFALAACFALILWRLLSLLNTRSVRDVWLFILSQVFSVFIHPIIVFPLMLPIAIFSIYIIFFQTEPRWPSRKDFPGWFVSKLKDPVFLRGFLPALAGAVMLVSLWYFTAGLPLLATLETNSSAALAEFRGYEVFTKGSLQANSPPFWWYALSMPNAISIGLTMFFLVGLGYTLVKWKTYHLILALVFIGAYFMLANLPTETWMHFAEILPVVAAISVLWIAEIKNKWLYAATAALLAITCLFVYSVVTWGFWSNMEESVAVALGAPLSPSGACLTEDQVFCPQPASHQNWGSKIEEVIKTVLSDPGCREKQCDLLVIRYSANFMKATFDYYQITEFPDAPLSLKQFPGIAFTRNRFGFRTLFNSRYIVYPDVEKSGNLYDSALTRLLRSPPASFSKSYRALGEFRLPDGVKIRLIKRMAPLTLKEAQDVIRAIDLDEKYKTQQYKVLAPLYVKAGQWGNALTAYKKAVKVTSKHNEKALYLFNIAQIYKKLGQRDKAAVEFEKVIELDPRSAWAQKAQKWLDDYRK
jgi:hypothetical protein